jgi:hypothetical protein
MVSFKPWNERALYSCLGGIWFESRLNTGCPEVFRGFLSVLAGKCWDNTSIRPQQFTSKSFPIHLPSYHLTLHNITIDVLIYPSLGHTGKSPRCPWDGPHSLSGRCGRKPVASSLHSCNSLHTVLTEQSVSGKSKLNNWHQMTIYLCEIRVFICKSACGKMLRTFTDTAVLNQRYMYP